MKIHDGERAPSDKRRVINVRYLVGPRELVSILGRRSCEVMVLGSLFYLEKRRSLLELSDSAKSIDII